MLQVYLSKLLRSFINQKIEMNKQEIDLNALDNNLALPFKVDPVSISNERQYGKLGNWTIKQKLKFCIFLEFHVQFFSIKANRRFFKLFKCLAYFLKSRTPAQCRSHYQKIKKTCSSQSKYINSLKEIVGYGVYNQYLRIYSQELVMTRKHLGYQKRKILDFQQTLPKKIQNCSSSLKLQAIEQDCQHYNNTDKNIRTRFSSQKTLSTAVSEFKKREIINKCDYHWKKYLQAILQLQTVIEQQEQSNFEDKFQQHCH